jgi:hypothetical protein
VLKEHKELKVLLDQQALKVLQVLVEQIQELDLQVQQVQQVLICLVMI